MTWLEYLGWTEQQLNDIRYVGYNFLTEGKYDIATTFFETLTILDPNNISDMQILGALYLENNKGLDALNYLEKALKYQPNHLPSILNRAKALFILGYKKQALALAKTLLECSDDKIKNQANALVQTYS